MYLKGCTQHLHVLKRLHKHISLQTPLLDCKVHNNNAGTASLLNDWLKLMKTLQCNSTSALRLQSAAVETILRRPCSATASSQQLTALLACSLRTDFLADEASRLFALGAERNRQLVRDCMWLLRVCMFNIVAETFEKREQRACFVFARVRGQASCLWYVNNEKTIGCAYIVKSVCGRVTFVQP
jgi:hypothetical protein